MEAESPNRVGAQTGAVFLSYASQDAEAAQKICDALRSAGVEVWFDKSELRGGDVWDRQIREQIHGCRLFVPVISANTEAREEGYFRREWGLATDRTRDMAEKRAFLIPVVIDDTPERGSSVPDKFHQIQWTRLPGGQTSAAFVARVAALLGAPAPVATAGSGPARVSAPTPRMWNRRAVWMPLGLAALSIAVGGGWFALQHSGLHRRAEAPVTGRSQPSVSEKSIAVLPFVDLSEKHDQEYFADGIAEEILDLLAQIPGLKVIGRTSSFQFKGNNSDLRKIGAALSAAYLLEGSVRSSGTTVKVTVQLIDSRDGTHRWAQVYEREIADALVLQKQIATAVARELQVSVSDYFGPGSETKSPEAYDMYLRGLRDVDLGDREAELRAIAEMSKAVETDPTYVNALVGLADAYDTAATDDTSPPVESYRLARLAVDKALTLDPKNADAYAMRAYIRMNTWDWSGAEQDIQKSLNIRKTGAAVGAEAKLALARGDLHTAEELLRNVLAVDPLDTYSLSTLANNVYPGMGRFSDADRLYAKMRDIDPDTRYINANSSVSALFQGRYELALSLAEKETDAPARETSLAAVYSAMGKPDMSKQAIDRLLRTPSVTDYWVAEAYAFTGQKELAFHFLEKTYDQRSPDLLLLKTDPLLASLRTDQRYKALVRKLNLPE
jgi:TolB-like protein/Flp pilus assembly protein TadD